MSDTSNLRVNDLVAKIAGVTLKDTTRVLMALDAVVDFLDKPADEVLSDDFEITRPSAENAEACSDAFAAFHKWLGQCDDSRWYDYLRSLR